MNNEAIATNETPIAAPETAMSTEAAPAIVPEETSAPIATDMTADFKMEAAPAARDANGKLILTEDNYFSEDADKEYMSVSQFKNFAGNTVKSGCEYYGYLMSSKQIPSLVTTALLQGSYVDSYFEGTLAKFKEENKEYLFKKTGNKGLKADFFKSENIIRRVNEDPVFMQYMSGQKQVIMTANLFGVDWKIKMDSYFPGDKIVDLKCMKNTDPIWCDKAGAKMHFIQAWGYDIQGAIYQKIVEIVTGKKLPFYIAVATKEDIPDIQLIEVDQEYLDAALAFVEENIQRVLDVKNGKVPPIHCDKCAYCKKNKKLSGPVKLSMLIPKGKNFGTDNDEEEGSGDENVSYDSPTPAGGFSLF